MDRLVSLPYLLRHSDAITPFHIDIQYDQIIGSGSPCLEKCFAAWIGVDPVDGVKHLGQLRLKQTGKQTQSFCIIVHQSDVHIQHLPSVYCDSVVIIA